MVSETTTQQINKAIDILRKGGVIVFPTETAYGLGADATNAEAVEKVFAIKGRDSIKSLPLIMASSEMTQRYAGMPKSLARLAGEYWPGPLTLVLPVFDNQLAPGVIRNGTIASRVSSHPIAQKLSDGLGRPIVSTSANISGKPSSYSIDEVKDQLGAEGIDFYLDGGIITPGLPSTIVTIDDYGYPEVLREGALKLDV